MNEPLSTPAPCVPPCVGAPSDGARWFKEEVQPHEPALKNWLRARFPWLLEVDDVSQEAVMRLWRRHSTQNKSALKSPKAVLFAIARNVVFDLGRRRAVVEIKSVAEIERLSVLDEQASVPDIVSTRQELEFLADALRDLPDGCRQVLTLCKMYGYSPSEVAEKLGISEHTVRAQIAKGLRRCSAYLRHRGVNRDPEISR